MKYICFLYDEPDKYIGLQQIIFKEMQHNFIDILYKISDTFQETGINHSLFGYHGHWR